MSKSIPRSWSSVMLVAFLTAACGADYNDGAAVETQPVGAEENPALGGAEQARADARSRHVDLRRTNARARL
jgi:hypothetical protein